MAPDDQFSQNDTARMLQQALKLQRDAYLRHPVPTRAERVHDLRQLARFVRDHRDELVAALHADYGHRATHETLLTEVVPVLAGVRHALAHLRGWMRPQRRHVDRIAYGLAGNRVVPQPVGVVGVIVPWNFPINLSLLPLVSIFAAGNRALVKMSENSRHLAALLRDRMPAYLPPEKLQFFDETGGVGVEFAQLPFDHLLFTGSGATGRKVMAAAARNLTPVTLELGGKSPAVVCDDFEPALAAERILYVKCLNAGQICTTVDHVWLPQSSAQAFIDAARAQVAKWYGSLDSADFTSIIDQHAYQRLVQALDEAQARGARLVPLLDGAQRDATRRRIAPTLVLDAPADCELMTREIFGPILPVRTYTDLEEVIAAVNQGPRPLALYPFSNRSERVEQLVTRIMSGGVSVNDALLHVGQEDLPFGGIGESGMGHYHGHEGFLTFSKLRPIFHQSRWSTLKLVMPPYGALARHIVAFLGR